MTGCNEQGALAGLEGVAFGVLVFVMGTLMVSNTWLMVDTKLATSAAAREAARTYVESDDAGAANDRAHTAARHTMTGHGAQPADTSVSSSDGFGRCNRVAVTVAGQVPMVAIPLLGAAGGTRTVRSSHSEVIDPYRSGLPGPADCNGD